MTAKKIQNILVLTLIIVSRGKMIDSDKKISYKKSERDIIEISEIEDSYNPVCNIFCNWLKRNDLGLSLYSFKKYYWTLMDDHKSASTINVVLVMMRRRFLHLFDKTNNLIDKRAIFEYKMKAFKSPSKVVKGRSDEKLFSKKEINYMISMTGVRTSLIIEFLYKTAIRRQEFCDILLKDCKEKRHHIDICIFGKGNKTRIIPVKKDLFKRIKNVFNGNKHLFEMSNGQKYNGKTVWALVSKPSKKLIDRHMSPHMLRHSCATHIFVKHGDLKALSLFLGHSSITITADIYQHTNFTTKQILED